jgi:hypothetical protein
MKGDYEQFKLPFIDGSNPVPRILIINSKPIKKIKTEYLHDMGNHMPIDMEWHDKKHLQKWFSKLTPEQRIKLVLQVEKFRKEAKFDES